MTAARILIVEDERIPAFNLQQRLKMLGYDAPKIVASGIDALDAISELKPDLVLMDIHLEGDIDGIETAQRIPYHLMIPVIYLTAYSEEATLQRAAATNASGYLVKPFSERELHATIQMALQRHRGDMALKKAEAELRQSREDFRYLFKNSPLPMWVFDVGTGRFLDVNDAAIATYGYSRDDFLTMTIFEIRPPEDAAAARTLLDEDVPAYMEAHSICHRRRDQSIIEVDVFSHALEFEGRPARITVTIDVTKRNRAEAHLRQAHRMEAIGQLTGGIAHDFNNLLAVIHGNLELLTERIGGDAKLSAFAGDALNAAKRGSVLTQRLLAFARQQPMETRLIAIEELVHNLDVLLRRTLGAMVELELNIAADLWPFRTDSHQLENALLNLAVNARDAMPHGGRLTIEAANVRLDGDYASDNAETAPGDYVMFAISDTGSGMTAEVAQKAFEPFFTTKAVGSGTGLGLSMVFGFVKQSGGHVKIYSEPGRGTTIKLYLPRTENFDAQGGSVPEVQKSTAANGETIMVVEDDEDVRKMVVTMTKELGYHVIQAEHGKRAIDLLNEGVVCDLLLTDVILPHGVSGPTLATVARRRLPGLRVLFMSGYTRDAIRHNRLLEDGVHLIVKPFRKIDLAIRLRELLDAKPEPNRP